MSALALAAWAADRNEADAILRRYNHSLVTNMPDMVAHWITLTHHRAQQHHHPHPHPHPGDMPTLSPHAFAVAEALQQLLKGTTDPVSGERLDMPLGFDVQVAGAALHELHAMPADGLLVMNIAEEYRRVHAAVHHKLQQQQQPASAAATTAAAAAAAGDIETLDQIVVPLLMGSEVPLTKEDAAEVVRHILADDAATAIKLTASFAGRTAHMFALRIGKPCLLDGRALYTRLTALVAAAPAQLYRALTALHVMGPGVFEPHAAPVAAVSSLLPMAPGPSLALRYARAVEAAFEAGGASPSSDTRTVVLK